MTKADLIDQLAAMNPGLRREEVALVVTIVFKEITAALIEATGWSCGVLGPSG